MITLKKFLQIIYYYQRKYLNKGIKYISLNTEDDSNNNLILQINYDCKKLISDNNKLILVGDYNYP